MNILTLVTLVVSFFVCGILYLGLRCVWTAPIARLRTTYTYRPRGSSPGVLRTIGLQSANHSRINEFPGHLILTLLLHEDNLFFHHRGFNMPEVRRAFWALVRRQGRTTGGSSVTQQLAKNIKHERGDRIGILRLGRKIREAIWTVRFERELTKIEILELYCSCVRLGVEEPYGFADASRTYFNCELRDLTIEQGFFLVGILPRPYKTVQPILVHGRLDEFRYVRAFEKFVELYRLVISLYGWGGVDTVAQLSVSEALSIMQRHFQYVPKAMPREFEAALYCRATVATGKLREVLSELASNASAGSRNSANPVPAEREQGSQ